MALVLALPAHADFGGFSGDSDYGGGGSSDYSGGYDYGDSSYDSGYYGGSSGGDDFFIGGLAVVVVIVLVIVFSIKNKKKGGAGVPAGASRTPLSQLQPMAAYINLDPAFNAADVQSKLTNLYVQLQNCWTAKDIEPLRPNLTNMLYEQSERQLAEIRSKNQTPHVERIAVLGVQLNGWYQSEGQDHIIAELSTRISVFTTDDGTGAIVKGNPNEEKFMTYEWDICRTTGAKTNKAAAAQDFHCPNCGAPMSINQSAKCPYCGSVVIVSDYDWVISNIKGLMQRTQ